MIKFKMPGLKERPEDIEPNLKFELDRIEKKTGRHITFNKEAWNRFLSFTTGEDAQWVANFRDLNGAVTRMTTLSPGGRINTEIVNEEIERLNASRQNADKKPDNDIIDEVLGHGMGKKLDRFETIQLADVLTVCRQSKSMSDAGRKLFSVSRATKKKSNDADRLRKYLAKYGIGWNDIT